MKVSHAVASWLLFALSACSAFESSDDDVTPGGSGTNDGGPGPIHGEGTTELKVTLPGGKAILTRRATTSVKVEIERREGFTGPVAITIANAPAELTAKPLELAAGSTSGDLELTASAALPQGELANVVIEASATTIKGRATAPLAAFVRGAPGELDQTYATQGAVSLPSAFALVDPQTGDLYGQGATRTHYRPDGSHDAAFVGTGSFGTRLHGTFTYHASINYPNGGEPEWYVRADRYALDTGAHDATYGANSAIFGGEASATTTLVSSTGQVALVGYTYATVSPPSPSYGNVWWFTASGAFAAAAATTVATPFHGGSFVSDGVIVTTNTGIAKIKTNATALDGTFAGGSVTIPSTGGRVTAVAEDAAKNVVVANATYTARVTVTGSIDGTFNAAATGLTPIEGIVKVAVQSDGKILKAVQLGTGDGSACAVVRYTPNGALDPTFGDQGKATYAVTPCTPAILAILPDKRILVGAQKVLRIWD
jgi:hypothetical protein